MKAVLGIMMMCVGLVAMAQEEVIAKGVDNGPEVELKLPEKVPSPLIQTYRTENGDLAAVVTPEEGDEYYVVPPQQAYQTQYPQDRESDVPVNDANWVLISW